MASTYWERFMGGDRLDSSLEVVQVTIDFSQSFAVVKLRLVEKLVGLQDEGTSSRDLGRVSVGKINQSFVVDAGVGMCELAPLRTGLHG
jgi:hypothetical protein